MSYTLDPVLEGSTIALIGDELVSRGAGIGGGSAGTQAGIAVVTTNLSSRLVLHDTVALMATTKWTATIVVYVTDPNVGVGVGGSMALANCTFSGPVTPGFAIRFRFNPPRPGILFRTQTTSRTLDAPAVAINKLCAMTVARVDTQMYFWVNGAYIGSVATGQANNPFTQNLCIGNSPSTDASDRQLRGGVQAVVFHDRVLATDEISTLHDALLGGEPIDDASFASFGYAPDEEPPAPVPPLGGSMIVKVGSYTGARRNSVDGDLQRVALPFQPDMVIVLPAGSGSASWRNNTAWHGRTQFFHSASSAYRIGPFTGHIYDPFRGNGFSVTAGLNVASETNHYIAIARDGGGYADTSWIGNNADDRAIDFTDAALDAVFVKRDAGSNGGFDRPAIFKAGSTDNIWGGFQMGTSNRVKTITSSGITISGDRQVNENVPPALGEGIEAIGFNSGATFAVVSYTGDGTGERAIALGIAANACLVLDGVNDVDAATVRHGFVTTGMAEDAYKPFDAAMDTTGRIVSLASSTLTVGAAFNVTGRVYRVWCWVDNSASVTQTIEPPRLPTGAKSVQVTRATGYVDFPDNSVGGASTLEWFGRIRIPTEVLANQQVPMVLLGEGADIAPPTGHADDYNGGLYVSNTDPDSNGWRGMVLRWLNSDYLRNARTSTDINNYNLNSGHIVREGDDIHVVLTHDGSGHWQLYLNGKKVKDYQLTGSIDNGTRSVGGTGTALRTLVGGIFDGTSTYSARSPIQMHRLAIWEGTELTRAQAISRYRNAWRGESYSGPTPTANYDYNAGEVGDATLTNATVVDHTNSGDNKQTNSCLGLMVAAVNQTSYTATSLIPAAGTYVIGVTTRRASATLAATVNSLTVSGVSQTVANVRIYAANASGAAAETHRVDFFVVNATGAGNVAVGIDSTSVVTGVSAWSVDSSTTPATTAAGAVGLSAASATRTLEITSAPSNSIVCAFSALSGYGGTRNFTPEIERDAFVIDFANIGSTSQIAVAEGWIRAQGTAYIRRVDPANSTGTFLGAVAIAQPANSDAQFFSAGGGSRSRARYDRAR